MNCKSNNFSRAILGLTMLSLSCAKAWAADVTLVQNGQARAVIVATPEMMAELDVTKLPRRTVQSVAIGRDNAAHPGRESIKDLATYFEKMSGAKIEILTSPPAAGDKRIPIYVGAPAVEKFGPLTLHDPAGQEFRVVVKPDGVGLMGENDRSTSYAVYEVLERLGCRWMMPSEMGEVVPELKTISLPVGDTQQAPGTLGRILWHLDYEYTRRIRNGGMGVSAGHALEVYKKGSGNFGYLTRQQLEDHPDWNAMIGGKRSINGRFCWGNPEVSDAVADAILKRCEAGGRYFSLSPQDGSNFCECDLCKKLDTGDFDPVMDTVSITDRFVNFCNRIATKVCAKYPDAKFGFLAYVQYTQPPTREKLHPALSVQLAPINYCRAHAITDDCASRQLMGRIVEGWGKAAPGGISYYQYMFNLAEYSAPYPQIHQMTIEQPFIYANGVRYWQPEGMTNMDQILPAHYLSNKMSWNPKDDPKRILDEFFTMFYGSAAEPMRKYWTQWDDAFWKVDEHSGANWGYSRRFTPAFMKTVRVSMDEALKAAKTDKEKFRVEMQNENLKQIELFMKLRYDLMEGRLANLGEESEKWRTRELDLSLQYKPQAAFSRVIWSGSAAAHWFAKYMQPPYTDAGRVSKFANWVSPPIRVFQWKQDTGRKEQAAGKEKIGEKSGWTKPDFDDKSWKTTDTGTDTFATMGIADFYGPVFYRATVPVKDVPADKRTFLWISATDGSARVWVNGQKVPYLKPDGTPILDRQGNVVEYASGYGRPITFDVSKFLKANSPNQITIEGTHSFINELGTGGLLGPVYLYQEKTPGAATKAPEVADKDEDAAPPAKEE